MPALPTSLALISIADGSPIVAADHRTNYTNVQVAVNALIAALSGGAAGQALIATGPNSVAFGSVSSASLAANIGAANTDLAAPAGTVNYIVATTGGGTLRSIGAAGVGAFLTIKNGTAASFITLKHLLAGGTGAQISIIGLGDRYIAPGQSVQFVYDGSNWQEINRPAQELICDQLLAGTQASFDTNTILGGNIPAVYSHLRFVVFGRGDTAASVVNFYARLNGDTGANYQVQTLNGTGAAAAGTEGLAQIFAYIGALPAASATASMFGVSEVTIPQYAGAVAHKSLEGINGYRAVATTGGGNSQRISAWWSNTAAVNRLLLFPSAGNLIAGTRLSLYGIT